MLYVAIASSPYGVVDVAWEATTANTVTLYFSEAPSVNEIRAIVYSSEIFFSRVGARFLDELDDTIVTAATSGQVLQFNGSNWVNSNITLNEISNVNVTGATTGQFLKFDGTNWIPGSVTGFATEGYVNTAISNLVDSAPPATRYPQ